MPVLTHKFTKKDRATKFMRRLRTLGFHPVETLYRKGVKTLYIVQYRR